MKTASPPVPPQPIRTTSNTLRSSIYRDTRRGSSENLNNNNNSSSVLGMRKSSRRRSSTSEISNLSVDIDGGGGTTSIFCPRPKKGFFYSRAWKEHKKKRKEKKKEHQGDDNSSIVDDEIPLIRDLTRRKRNSFAKHESTRRDSTRSAAMEPTNVTAYLAARVESERPVVDTVVYNHSAKIVHAGTTKAHMMDISLVGKGGVVVGGSRFILACYSPVLEDIFFKGAMCPNYDAKASKLELNFCNEEVLKAAVHHSFSGQLPTEFSITSPSEKVVRNLAQLDHMAYLYKFQALGDITNRAARKLINHRAVLACAVFDELSYREGAGSVDSIKRYAIDTIREMPMDTLLAGGVQWMKEESVEAIMQDQDMEVDEYYMFTILKSWVKADTKARMTVAQRLSQHIELKFIDTELLMNQVKASGYFAEKDIIEAVKLINDSMADRDPSEMERVLVEGAGTEIVNGIYCRVAAEDEMGMSEEEILFVKEADDGYSDLGLYLWGTTWNIAMCADYSNCFYTCEDPINKSSAELVPRSNWEVQFRGANPPPCCTYLPITRMGRMNGSSEKGLIAPNLEEMMDPTIAEKRRSQYFDRTNQETIEKRIMTLEQMMNLPEDRGDAREDHEEGY